MPTYCYKTKEGVFYERLIPFCEFSKAPPDEISVLEDGYGIKAYRDRQAEVQGLVTSVRSSENSTRLRRRKNPWPMDPCVGSGVGPHGAQELRDHFTTHDVPTEVTRDGEPIYTSAKHRKKALKCRSMHSRNEFS